jgi:uncharacterized membrane protein
MKMATGQQLIDDYLARLERAAQVLATERRTELLAEIRGHINDARSERDPESEVGVQALLDRLGSPEEIVAAAADGDQSTGGNRSTAAGPPRSMTLETWAVLMLTAGSIVLPVVGWLVGVVLMWSSDRWQTREKILGTAVVPGGIGLYGSLLFFASSVETCFSASGADLAGGSTTSINDCDTSSSWTDAIVPVLFGLGAVAALVVPFFLLYLARRRASAEQGERIGARVGQPVG